jgi:hypothetical protein
LDTFTLHWLRTVMTVATAVVAAWIALIATHSHASWWAVLAAPVVLVPTYLFMLILNLVGWNRRWTASSSVLSNRTHLQLHLEPKDPTVRYSFPEVDCRVRISSGEAFSHRSPGVQPHKGRYYAQYPQLFDQAPPLAPGKHKVTWVEEKRPGKWREIVTARVTV